MHHLYLFYYHDHYLQKLGKGACSIVKKATNEFNQTVAVKIILSKQQRKTNHDGVDNHNDKDDEHLMNEIQLLKELNHPNIIQLHDVFLHDRNYYLVMDFMSGGNLYQYIRNTKQKEEEDNERESRRTSSSSSLSSSCCCYYFNEEEVKEVSLILFDVVRYLHYDKRIVHRDLKLENILLEVR